MTREPAQAEPLMARPLSCSWGLEPEPHPKGTHPMTRLSTSLAVPDCPRPKRCPRPGIRDVHIKRVPESIWLRARQNALQSGLPFKDFVIRLLAQSEPFQLERPLQLQQQPSDR